TNCLKRPGCLMMPKSPAWACCYTEMLDTQAPSISMQEHHTSGRLGPAVSRKCACIRVHPNTKPFLGRHSHVYQAGPRIRELPETNESSLISVIALNQSLYFN